MTLSRPDWYDSLEGNPLRKRTFTKELAERIKERTIHSAQTPSARRMAFRRIIWVGGAVLFVLGVLLFSRDTIIVDRFTSATSELAQSKETFSEIPSEIKLMEAINPEFGDTGRQILYKQIVDNSRMLLFTKKIVSDQGKMIWEVGYANWTSEEVTWTKEKDGEIQIDLISADEYKEAFENGHIIRFIAQDTPISSDSSSRLVFGSVGDSRVSSVRITDENYAQYDAKFIDHAHGGYSLWFIVLPETQGTIKVEALNREGLILDSLET